MSRLTTTGALVTRTRTQFLLLYAAQPKYAWEQNTDEGVLNTQENYANRSGKNRAESEDRKRGMAKAA